MVFSILLTDSCTCVHRMNTYKYQHSLAYFGEIRIFPDGQETFHVLCERITIENPSLLESN